MRDPHTRLRRLARAAGVHALVLGLYSICTWLVMFGRSTLVREQSFAGGLEHDAGTYVWYLWHLKEGLFGDGRLLFSDRIFFPVGMNMVRQDWTPTTSALGLPFQWLGSIGAYNMEVALAFVMCGYFTYLLARHLEANRPMAFLAGMIFAFCEFRILKACYHGHLTHVNQQFIPLYVLFTLRYFRGQGLRDAAGAGLAFFLATFCTPYQMVFLLVFSVILVVHRFFGDLFTWSPLPRLRPGQLRPALRRSLGFSALAGGTAVLLVAPLIIGVGPRSLVSMPAALSRFQSIFSADLLSYVVPTLGKDMGWPYFSGEGGCAFQGYTVMALGVLAWYGAFRWRTGVGFWLGCCVIFFLLSLGSMLVIGGKEVIWLPFYAVLEQIPIVRHARVASRFSALLTLCLGLAVAVTLTRAEQRFLAGKRAWRPWLLRGAALAAVGFELLSYRVTITTVINPEVRAFPIPRVYERLAAQRQDSSILIYPLIWEVASAHLGPLHFPRDYYFFQTVHRKRLITGFGDALPSDALPYWQRLPLLGQLVRIEQGEQPAPPSVQQRADARFLVRALGIRTILVNRDQVAKEQVDARGRASRALAYLQQLLPVRVASDDGVLTVLEPEPELFAQPAVRDIHFDSPSSAAHLGVGFRRTYTDNTWVAESALVDPEWEVLYLPMERGAGQRLYMSLRCTHFATDLLLELDGRALGKVRCPASWSVVSLPLPAEALRGEGAMNRVRFLRAEQPGEGLAIPVGDTGVKTAAQLKVVSRGLAAGNQASILLGGVDLAPDVRGYNLAVIHPQSGENIMSVGFDLVTDETGAEADRLVQLIQNVPRGMIVAVAVKDDGSINLTDGIIEALRSVGAARDLRNLMRHSYAMVGVKGARPGTALEAVSESQPAEIELGSLLQIRRVQVR